MYLGKGTNLMDNVQLEILVPGLLLKTVLQLTAITEKIVQ